MSRPSTHQLFVVVFLARLANRPPVVARVVAGLDAHALLQVPDAVHRVEKAGHLMIG